MNVVFLDGELYDPEVDATRRANRALERAVEALLPEAWQIVDGPHRDVEGFHLRCRGIPHVKMKRPG